MTVIRLSSFYMPTLREVPSDAEIASHQLLLRAGMMRKIAAGIYSFLPLGMKVLAKVEAIVREEMDAIGAQEILMPALQPEELWIESGRWDDYGPELMRLRDRHDHGFCLGPTHEELITFLVRNELRSYKELPCTLYQIQTKYRDEIRPRFGLLRSREFIMKDAYSFNADQDSLQETYEAMGVAYGKICDRCGLEYRAVEADSGQIGGKVSCEYMALADAGEAELVTCPSCGYAANTEAGACHAHPTAYGDGELTLIETPGVATIAELAQFLSIPESSTVKALVGKDSEGQIIALFIPGDHELNEIKVSRLIDDFVFLTDEEMEAAGLPKGSIGPVGLPEGVLVYADENLEGLDRWVVGANKAGFHYSGARCGRDFTVDRWADLSIVKAGDACPHCGTPLELCRGIEVSQIFQLGEKYSRAMNASYLDQDGKERPFVMGCYGVGVTRTLAAVVEQHHDDQGICWPEALAPAEVCVIAMNVGDELVQPAAESLVTLLESMGVECALDDRKERPGVKFADADLVGWPIQVIIGKRSLEQGCYEVKFRESGERFMMDQDVFGAALLMHQRAGEERGSLIELLKSMAS